MDLQLINKIIKNKYGLSYKRGHSHFLNGNVKIVDVKEINNTVNVYGRVNQGADTYFTQIKTSTNKAKFICNCEFAKEAGESLPCEHVVATILKLNEDHNYVSSDSKNGNVKITLILEETFHKDHKFDAYLFLDGRGRVRIDSKLDLNCNIFDKNGRYYIESYKYTEENIKLFKMLGAINFKIKDENIKKLFINSIETEVKIKIDSMRYDCIVKKEPLPLKFSIREKNNKIHLQTVKIPIKALNTNKSVYLFNNTIYVPPFEQYKAYIPIYNALHQKYYGYIRPSSLNEMINLLRGIGELTISEEINEILSENEEIKLLFYRDDESIKAKFNTSLNITRVKKAEEILYLHKFTKKENEYVFLGDDSDLYYLLKTDILNYCSIEAQESLKSFGLISKDRIKTQVIDDDGQIKYDIYLEDIDNSEWMEAVNTYNKGQEFYKFNNYSFIDFKDKDTASLMKLLSFIGYKGQTMNLDVGYYDLLAESCNFMDEINKTQEIEEKITTIKGLQAKLREYQKEGVAYLQDKKKASSFGILADEMGLGKTIQTIAFVLNNSSDKTLIITPTSLIYNWESEFKKFAPNLEVACIHGDKKKRLKFLENISEFNVIITSYGTLNMDIGYYEEIIFDNLIIDEAQNIKNPRAKVTKNVKKLNSKVRFALTGTPLENNYLELWSIFDYLKPGYLFSESEFKNKFLRDVENIKFLKLMIRPFILRRTKKQVLKELPDKIETTYYVKMTDEQAKYYNSKLKKIAQEAKNTNNQISILALLTKLRQIALDPSLIDEKYTGGSGKVEAAVDIITKCVENNKKIIIFSQFTSMLHNLEDKLNLLKINYYYMDGKTNASDRVKLCDDFNKSKTVCVFLISLKAGGTGLNLTSAQAVLHFDPWWNPQVENQATDRAHRIGQKNQVEVIKMISKNTIEEKILSLKQEKDNIFTNILEQNELVKRSNLKLTKQEIEYLLSI